jgi:hypothetical protein
VNCPKCGAENADTCGVCRNCGQTLQQEAVQKRKFSKLAIISFVLGILSLLFTLLTGIPAIICSIISLRKIRKSGGLLKGKGLSIAGLSISLISPFVIFPLFLIWRIDAPPIPNDYTIADLRSAGPEYDQTFQLLQSFGKEEYLEDPLEPNEISKEDRKKISETLRKGSLEEIQQMILSKSEQINQAWIEAQKGRDIIKQLNSFAEIADLTKPSISAQFHNLRYLRQLAKIYRSYIFLHTELGDSKAAAQALIEFDSVFRKLSVNARGLILKLVCYAILGMDIQTANYIANNPKTGIESIELLSNHFKPFDYETVSIRNCFINEYLMFRNTLDTDIHLKKLADRPNIALKRNSTLRAHRNFCDSIIKGERDKNNRNRFFSVWPKNYPSLMPKVDVDVTKEAIPFIYKCYNPVGALLICILTPPYGGVIRIKTGLEIEDDILQIVLDKRLNKEINLKARAYSDEYIIDVNDKKIVSPGPDCKIGTDDDITLPINPEVLNLIKTP